MTKNPHRMEEKQRRALRRRNHFARDLWTPEFRQRKVNHKDINDYDWTEELDDWYDSTRNSDEDLYE